MLLYINEIEKIELAQRELEERLMASHTVPAGLGKFHWNLAANEVEVDAALAQLMDIPPSEMVMSLDDVTARIHPDDRAAFLARNRRCIEERGTCEVEYRILLPDGSSCWVLDRGQVSTDSGGRPVAMVGTWVHVTSRKRTEDELDGAEVSLRSALSIGQMGSWELALDTGNVIPSAGLDRLCGFEPQAERPLSAYIRLILSADLPLAEGILRRPPSQFRVELRIRPKGEQRVVWVAIQGEQIQSHPGNLIGLRGAVSDISYLKQTELLLQKQSFELEARVRELNCLYTISRLVQQQEELDQLLEQIVQVIPTGFSRPDNIGVRLVWMDKVFQSTGFTPRPARLSQELLAQGQVVGRLELQRSGLAETGGFSSAEQALIYALRKPISRAIERKQVLQALSESEDRWRTMAGALAEGLVLFDWQARVDAWNRSAEHLLGISLFRGLSSDSYRERFIREDGSSFPTSNYPVMVSLESGIACNGVEMGIRKDNGGVSWLSVNTRPLFHAGEKKPYAVVASFADITERKRAEEVIQREIEAKELERSRLNTVLEALPVAVYIADADGTLLQVNAAVEEMWGEAPVSGDPGSYHDDRHSWWSREGQVVPASEWGLSRALSKGESVLAEEMEVQRRDGTLRTVLNYALPFYDTDGHIAGGVGVSVDISDRKSSEGERALLAGIVEASPDGIASTDLHGHITSWNTGAERMYGYRADEILGKSISVLMPPECLDELDMILRAIARGEGVTYFDSTRLHKCGRRVDVSVAVMPITDNAGQVVGAAKIDRDISDRKRSDTERALLAAIVKASPDAIASTDMHGRITSWNAGAELMYGYRADEILGKSIAVLMPPECQEELDMILSSIAEGKGVTYFDSTRLRKNGERVEVSVAVTPITDAAGRVRGAAKIDRDITQRKRMEQQFQHDAFHDRLTGVSNRSLFMDRLGHVVARAERFGEQYAVFVMDMDNFKLINDSFGHQVGDKLLCAFVNRIQELLRPVDTLARFGGDEFMLLLEEIENQEAVEQVAARILKALQRPFILSGQEIAVTSSIGIMLGDSNSRTGDQVIRDADMALYEAKRQGKNQYVVFDARMRGEEASRMYLEAELRRALQAAELYVQYQPIVDLSTGEAVGCEALARWKHPVMGRVDPSRFINVAEDTGLITPLGRFVLERACATLAGWLKRPGFPADFYVSVNISPKEFYAKDLVSYIEAMLNRCQLSGTSIRLEITENVIIQHDQEAAAILYKLRELGVRTCLDDFGTGYSSLSYLHQLPFDVIKVDRSFIQRLAETKQSREIVRSILGLASALDMQAIAEGAETPEQLAQVHALGFRWAQGYMLHRPMDRTAVSDLFDGTA